MLALIGPTIAVDIGFDATYQPQQWPLTVPMPTIRGVRALVDTGAGECFIDDQLAIQLGLPAIDRRKVAGISGVKETVMYLAQLHIPTLGFTMYGEFGGVDLAAGGQPHRALIGRSFLQRCTLIYDGKTGDVTIRT